MGYNIEKLDEAFEKAIKDMQENIEKNDWIVYYPINVTPTPSNCLHDNCPECHGSGVKKEGGACIHFISCPCPKCNPMF